MSIKIVLPKNVGGVKSATGTKVFTENGEEIKGIKNIFVELRSDRPITALLEVFVSDIENLEAEGRVIAKHHLEQLQDCCSEEGIKDVTSISDVTKRFLKGTPNG